ncbi:MAG: haloacid dehalogenase type II [Pseudarthrobacter sp.]
MSISASGPVFVFDVNETLSDLAPMAGLFEQGGLPAHLAPLWFAQVLRDGFALTAAGGTATFAEIGRAVLEQLAPHTDPKPLLAAMSELPLHPDVAPGVRALRAAGATLLTLSNGSTAVAEALLTTAQDCFHRLLSVDDAGAWKPAARAYHYAAQCCEVSPSQLMLVAVHPWDIDGASRAGLQTAWINRTGNPYPSFFASPDRTVRTVGELLP